MKKINFLLALFFVSIFSSCDTNLAEERDDLDLNKYKNLKNALINNLSKLGNEIRKNGLTHSDKDAIEEIGKSYFSGDSYNVTYFNAIYLSGRGVASGRTTSDPSLEGEEIINSASQYSSLEDYLSYLDTQFSAIAYSSMSAADKDYLLTFITAYQAGLIYIDSNLDIVAPSTIASTGWWDSWGQCAAGIIGGAGLGALSFAGYGGAGCTVVLPGVGTVACGTVGAVAGAIFGGLTGASQSC